MVLEKLIGQFLFDKAADGSGQVNAARVPLRASGAPAVRWRSALLRRLRHAPGREVDPLEPMNRAMFDVHEASTAT